MSKDYFFRVTLELNEEDPIDRDTLAFDFADGDRAMVFAEMAYLACDIINVDIKILHDEKDTTNSPMWRQSYDIKQRLNSTYGLYADTDSVGGKLWQK